MIKRLSTVKKYCVLCKNQPCEQLADHVFRCVRCGYTVDETKDPAYHQQVLVSKPSIYREEKKYVIKDEVTRSEEYRRINKEFEKATRLDRQSMYNPNINLQPGKVSRTGEWMSAVYANLATEMDEESLNRFFRANKNRK
jgi:ribosomal protein L37AE/L43A